MAYRSLRDFIARLEEAGEFVRVKEPVSTFLEMTEIQTRLLAEGGPAVLFEHAVLADGRLYVKLRVCSDSRSVFRRCSFPCSCS